jgi:erythronate-4-phosphate dehydrogenase
MIIAVDDKIPYWEQAFPPAGEVRPFSGRKVGASDLRDADALIVRSVTRVDASLLEGTRIRFVGTATIGMDHLDEKYLQRRGTYFTNAAGSNANSVAEHVTAALLLTAGRRGWNLARKSMAVIGVGHVGSRVVRKAACLGIETLLCDPPLRETTGDKKYLFLEDVMGADLLTLHVPLTKEGAYPTWHMFDEGLLDRLTARQFLLNTSRGAVIDNRALKRALRAHAIEGAVLDVWEGEPHIDYELLRETDLGSSHIAGYSLDGKIQGTAMILEELCRFFGISFAWDTAGIYPPLARIAPAPGTSGLDAICSVVLQAFDIRVPDANLRALEPLAPEVSASAFDRLRNDYPLRPEFCHFVVELNEGNAELAAPLAELGFRISGVAQSPASPAS